jgi:hypothetical protein
MMKQGYTNWVSCFEEHLVRIIEIKIAELLNDKQFIIDYRDECINDRGFIYFERIENLILDYENNRNRYKNFQDFIPVLIHKININLPNLDN